MSSPIFNGTNGEAHKTQHITARKVVEVNSFFIPQQLTRTNVRKELYLLSLTEAFFAEGIEQKKAKMFKNPHRPARAFPATSRVRPIARKRPEIENVLGESKKAAKDTNLKNKT